MAKGRAFAFVFAMLVGCAQPSHPVAPAREAPDLSSYRARVTLDLGPDSQKHWIDIVVDGTGDEHKRACELAVGSALRFIGRPQDAKGGVGRACGREPVPPIVSTPASYLLVQEWPIHAALRLDALVTHVEPVASNVRVRATSFTRYSSRTECDEMLTRFEAMRREFAKLAAENAAKWLPTEIAKATVERDTTCARERQLAAECTGTREHALGRHQCELELLEAQRGCERMNQVVDESRPTATAPRADPPSCRPG